MIVWRTKFSFVGMELRQARHIKFLTLLGTCKDHTLSIVVYPSSKNPHREVNRPPPSTCMYTCHPE